jgi:hypothetical protein
MIRTETNQSKLVLPRRLPAVAFVTLLAIARAPAEAAAADKLCAPMETTDKQGHVERTIKQRYVDRPLTLPACVLSPSVTGAIEHRAAVSGFAAEHDYGAAIGMRGGLINGVELEVIVGPILFARDVPLGTSAAGGTPASASAGARYGNPILRGTARIFPWCPVDATKPDESCATNTPAFELGVRASVQVLTQINGVDVELGFPFLARAGHSFRFDSGAFLSVRGLAARAPVVVGGTFPLTLTWNPADIVRLGLRTGIEFNDFGRTSDVGLRLFNFTQPADKMGVPFGVFTAFSIDAGGGVLDLSPFLTFPRAFTPLSDGPKNNLDYMAGMAVEFAVGVD